MGEDTLVAATVELTTAAAAEAVTATKATTVPVVTIPATKSRNEIFVHPAVMDLNLEMF
jgi:hypothetical protein